MAADKSAQKTTPSLGDYFKSNIREYGLLIALVVIMLFFQFMTGGVLFRPVNITNLILQNSFIVIMALGMLLIIVAGHIDLSVGSIVAFTGGLSAIMLVKWGIHFSIVVPLCLILDEPTRGIDVGAKYEIYTIINQLAAEGKGILMISSEMPELLGTCDRIYVMNEGRIVAELSKAEASQESIMRAIMRSGEKH